LHQSPVGGASERHTVWLLYLSLYHFLNTTTQYFKHWRQLFDIQKSLPTVHSERLLLDPIWILFYQNQQIWGSYIAWTSCGVNWKYFPQCKRALNFLVTLWTELKYRILVSMEGEWIISLMWQLSQL